MMNRNSDLNVEKAAVFLASALAGKKFNKPVILHSIRVGTRLHSDGYEPEVVIAGYLHDVVEDGDVEVADISKLFGANVASIVAANTKDIRLTDKTERRRKLIKQCLAHSEKAAIVKAADILDNYAYYKRVGDAPQAENCKNNMKLFTEYFNNSYAAAIFNELFIASEE